MKNNKTIKEKVKEALEKGGYLMKAPREMVCEIFKNANSIACVDRNNNFIKEVVFEDIYAYITMLAEDNVLDYAIQTGALYDDIEDCYYTAQVVQAQETVTEQATQETVTQVETEQVQTQEQTKQEVVTQEQTVQAGNLKLFNDLKLFNIVVNNKIKFVGTKNQVLQEQIKYNGKLAVAVITPVNEELLERATTALKFATTIANVAHPNYVQNKQLIAIIEQLTGNKRGGKTKRGNLVKELKSILGSNPWETTITTTAGNTTSTMSNNTTNSTVNNNKKKEEVENMKTLTNTNNEQVQAQVNIAREDSKFDELVAKRLDKILATKSGIRREHDMLFDIACIMAEKGNCKKELVDIVNFANKVLERTEEDIADNGNFENAYEKLYFNCIALIDALEVLCIDKMADKTAADKAADKTDGTTVTKTADKVDATTVQTATAPQAPVENKVATATPVVQPTQPVAPVQPTAPIAPVTNNIPVAPQSTQPVAPITTDADALKKAIIDSMKNANNNSNFVPANIPTGNSAPVVSTPIEQLPFEPAQTAQTATTQNTPVAQPVAPNPQPQPAQAAFPAFGVAPQITSAKPKTTTQQPAGIPQAAPIATQLQQPTQPVAPNPQPTSMEQMFAQFVQFMQGQGQMASVPQTTTMPIPPTPGKATVAKTPAPQTTAPVAPRMSEKEAMEKLLTGTSKNVTAKSYAHEEGLLRKALKYTVHAKNAYFADTAEGILAKLLFDNHKVKSLSKEQQDAVKAVKDKFEKSYVYKTNNKDKSHILPEKYCDLMVKLFNAKEFVYTQVDKDKNAYIIYADFVNKKLYWTAQMLNGARYVFDGCDTEEGFIKLLREYDKNGNFHLSEVIF